MTYLSSNPDTLHKLFQTNSVVPGSDRHCRMAQRLHAVPVTCASSWVGCAWKHEAYSAVSQGIVSERSPETLQRGQSQDLYSDKINQPMLTDCRLDKCERPLLLWRPCQHTGINNSFFVQKFTLHCEKRDSGVLSDAQFEDREWGARRRKKHMGFLCFLQVLEKNNWIII